MRLTHFEQLQPQCPTCGPERNTDSALELTLRAAGNDEDVTDGMLCCPVCTSRFPIIDGIPILVPNLREYLANNIAPIMARGDLSPEVENLLGECCGPGSAFDTQRQVVSCYAWDHYADLDPAEEETDIKPGSIIRLLDHAITLAGELPNGATLDAGCATGRTAFELAARTGSLTLGIDLNFDMLRIASRTLRHGKVSYAKSRIGLIYEDRRFAVDMVASEYVDFWACDVTALPIAADRFNLMAALNLLDSVRWPLGALQETRRVLCANGIALIATPYDWSAAATPVDGWLGGRSALTDADQRVQSELLALLTSDVDQRSVGGFRIAAESANVPWRVRLHERSSVDYLTHLLIMEKHPT